MIDLDRGTGFDIQVIDADEPVEQGGYSWRAAVASMFTLYGS